MLVKILVSTLLLGVVFPFTLQAREVQYCDRKGNYAIKVSGVEITPEPITRGAPTTFNISASTDEGISQGKLVIDVSYFGFHVHSETHDLCGETSCPISTGDFVISHTQSLPGVTPPGNYYLKMRVLGKSDEQLTCIGFDFSIGFFADS